MAKKKSKYPKWFSEWNKPYAPTKPRETMRNFEVLAKVEAGNWDMIPVPQVEGATHISIEVEMDPYDRESVSRVQLSFGKEGVIANPRYKKELEYYEKEYAEYKAKLKEWNKYKKEIDKEKKEADLARRKAMYEKLKREFEAEETIVGMVGCPPPKNK